MGNKLEKLTSAPTRVQGWSAVKGSKYRVLCRGRKPSLLAPLFLAGITTVFGVLSSPSCI